MLASLAACATEKPDIDPTTIDAIDINESKGDSLRFPTLKGMLGVGDSTTGRVSPAKSYHAYDFTYAGAPGNLRLDARSTTGRDLVLVAYARSGPRWVLSTWNDDCGDGTLNSCLTLPTAGRYRFVVTTYDALAGSSTTANYSLSIACASGGCAAQQCGGLQGLQCGAGEYCAYALDAFCGAADDLGTCEPMPEFCTEQYEPVCGCNDQTYGNACMAAAAGVAVSALGECAVQCGGRAGDTCNSAQYCRFDRIAICGHADGQGVCETRPQGCLAQFAPVCGCDNQTYSNECVAAAAGIGTLHDGACTVMP
ncbi:MAG: hypothetical protein H0T89_24490 [Deltaproteobacteria bacterium]|nr:hypothetical protein [Deltaproteobacteria bacterium]